MRTTHAIAVATIAILTSSCALSVPRETHSPAPASAPDEPAGAADEPAGAADPEAAPAEPSPVVVHVVVPGQTLWRIARAYGVHLSTLAAANGIVDPSRVEVGTSIRIPGAKVLLDVPPFPMPVPPPPVPQEPFTEPPGAAALHWPVEGGTVISAFGVRRGSRQHAGLDIRGAPGQEIRAARAGRVAFSGTQRGYGHVVFLDHGDGMETVYAHAQSLLVKAGEVVEGGQPIARVGRSGNASTHHLHFEVRRDGRVIDPSLHFQAIAEVAP